jgi:hypothetical protein
MKIKNPLLPHNLQNLNHRKKNKMIRMSFIIGLIHSRIIQLYQKGRILGCFV